MLCTGNLGLDLSQQNSKKQKQKQTYTIKNKGAYMNLSYNLQKRFQIKITDKQTA